METYSGICNFCRQQKENMEMNEFEGARVYICEDCKSNPGIYNFYAGIKTALTPLNEPNNEENNEPRHGVSS